MPLPAILRDYMTAGEAAILTGLDVRWIRRMCEEGKAPGCLRVGDGRHSIWLVRRDEVGDPVFARPAPFGRHAPKSNPNSLADERQRENGSHDKP